MSVKFRHRAVSSALFGVVYRPMADVLVRTKDKGDWVSISMVVDTGADYTIMPKRYAPLLGIDVNVDCVEHRQKRKRLLMAERFEMLSRYGVNSPEELKEKIESGEVPEHPTWEDYIELANLEDELARSEDHFH